MPMEREACGLGALLPVSCRGRAESFARRLHTRLRSLGGGGGGLGGSTDLLRGTDDEEEGIDFAGAMGGWGGSGDGDEVGDVYGGGNGEASGGSRGAEGGCSAKYRSTDRGAPGTVTVQQPHPTPGPAGHSPSPPAGGSSPPFSSSPRPRLDSGLESLGSPNSGTPPRPGSNGSESGVAGINTPANGYFSPPNDAGFSSGRWHTSPSPEKEQQSRSPHQRIRRRRDIRWPPSHPVEAVVGEGEAALPNFLECFPQSGVDSPPETSWSPSSMSPENGVGGGMRFVAPGGIDEVDSRSAGDAYWNHYSYFRHGFPARSPATPPLLQSPDLLPLNAKGISSPTSYTPPCSPMSPVETHYEPLNCSPVMGVKSPISEGNEEEEEDGEARVQDEFLSQHDEFMSQHDEFTSQHLPGEPLHNHNITHEPETKTDEQEEVIDKHEEELSNGHSTDELPVAEEIEEITNPFVDPIQREMTEIDLLALEFSVTHLSNVELEKEEESDSNQVEEEVSKSEDEEEESPPQTESNQEVDKVEKSTEEEDALSEDSMERDIQNLAEKIYGKGAGVEGLEDEEEVGFEGDNHNAVQLKPHGEGDCSPEEETTDEAELRKKYLDADSSVMDLKAVRIICEEMASRAMKGEGDTVIIGITEVGPSEGATLKAIEPEDGSTEEGGAKCLEVKTPDDDEEESVVRVPRVRRSTSLKTGKTPPGTPSRKKIVRFADVLGLDLADVRTFLDEIPHVPRSAFQDLAPDPIFDPLVSSPSPWEMGPSSRVRTVSRRPRRYHLTPIFPQPGAAADFIDRIRDRCICLESAMEEDVDDEEDDGSDYFGVNGWSVLGTVRVRNLAFHKTVHARASADGWRSHADVPASYLPGSCDGFSDRFAFEIRPGIPPTGGVFGAAPFPRRLPNGGRLEFAVRFQCQGSQYWDNNLGANYVFSVEPLINPAISNNNNNKPSEEERPPATPAPNPRTSTKAFQYLSLPSPDVDWATFL